MGSDGVHMNPADMRKVAAQFCRRVTGAEGEPEWKRRRQSDH